MAANVHSTTDRAAPSALSRRVFVRAATGLAATGVLSSWIACDGEPSAAPDAALDAGTATGSCLDFLTPSDAFFRQFGGASTVEGWQLPELDGESFRLRIEGLVETPLALSLAELEADEASHLTVVNTLMCVLGFRSTALWTGVPLRTLLDRAGLDRAAAVRVRFFGADGFENNLKITDIYDGPADMFEPLIAFRLYDQPLPRELGHPFRLLLADRYGFKNTKWLERIEVTDSDEVTGQYQERGYDDAGVIEPVPTVEDRLVSQSVRAGPLELCGIALSGGAGVERVELSLDGGDYAAAELPPLARHLQEHPELAAAMQLDDPERFGWPLRGVWALWQAELTLPPGEHTLDVRVRDRAGGIGQATTLRFAAES